MIAGALLLPSMEQAHGQSRTIINTGFDKLLNGANLKMAPNGVLMLDDARCAIGTPDRCMAGWQSTHPPRNSYGHMIEAGANKTTYGVAPNSGWPLSN